MKPDVYWHCLHCGDHETAEAAVSVGDVQPCKCGATHHAMTLETGARHEQGIAMGMSVADAWKRANSNSSARVCSRRRSRSSSDTSA